MATSASSINSALESQITYWDNYNQNLEKLNERAADIDGLNEVIASFADGSKDSVNAIAGMASASDADLAKMVENYRSLQEAQESTSDSLADLQTGMSNALDEIAQDLSDSVSDMDLSDEAVKSARATIQGFIDGAENMTPLVKEAYGRVASAATSALSTANSNYNLHQRRGNIPGYAVGTESAAPGFAIVGEKGPELVYFDGGETVLTATETRTVLDKAERLSALDSEIRSTREFSDSSEIQKIVEKRNEYNALQKEANSYSSLVKSVSELVYLSGSYAAGTDSAKSGLALVGEKGPELVYFGGGETVSTTPETSAAFNEALQLEQIVSTNTIDLSAVWDAIREEKEAQTLREEYSRYVETVNGSGPVYFNGGETRSVTEVQLPGSSASGGSNTSSAAPITVAPVYHIYGVRDTDELRSVLNAQNDDLREAVLEIVSDNDTDNFRRGYA